MTSIHTNIDRSSGFGQVCSAMVTPMKPDESIDLRAAANLATYLVDEQSHDAIVLNGTTGEAPTTTDAEKRDLIYAVAEAVGDRATVIAGVGTPDTAHSIRLASDACSAGADLVMLLAPYYSRPTQGGVLAHFHAVLDACGLPMVVYDIPVRTATPIETRTLIALGEDSRVVAVKDAKGDLAASALVIRETGLAFYSGEDSLTLPILSIGGRGVIGTSTHFCGNQVRAMIDAHTAGDNAEALRIHRQLLPLFSGIFRLPGTVLVKEGLSLRGRPVGPVRLPLIAADGDEQETLLSDLSAAGV